MRLYEKQDDQGQRGGRRRGTSKFLRAKKHRVERRRAKRDPECAPCYGKYRGWVMLLPLCLMFTSCASKPDPAAVYDYNDLPDGYNEGAPPTFSVGSLDYQNGFRAGFYEGLTYNQITP